MKRVFWVSLMILITFVLVLGGCSKSTPSPSKTSPSAQTQAPAPVASAAPTTTAPAPATTTAPKKVFALKFTDMYAPANDDAKLDEALGKLIEDNTGGQVKITYYHAEALGKSGDFINLLNGGVADIANISTGWFPSMFTFFEGLEIPTIGFTDRASRVKVDGELYKMGYYKEFDNFKVLAFNSTPPMNLFMKKNSPDVASLAGAKIRANNENMRNWLANLGATAVSMAAPDIYMALDRGTIDGLYTGYPYYMSQKFYEVCKYAIWNPISCGCSPVIMNKNIWNSMPADVQSGIDKAIEAFKTYYVEYWAKADTSAADDLKKQGVTVYSFDADNAAKLAAAAGPLKDKWITTMQAKNLPAKEMLDAVAKILAAK